MQNLATEILRAQKKKATFWKVATIVSLTVTIIEFIAIIF